MDQRASRQLSKTQIYKAGDELVDESDSSNGEEIINDRLNMSAAMGKIGFKGSSKPHTPLGLIKHTPSTTYADSGLKPRG